MCIGKASCQSLIFDVCLYKHTRGEVRTGLIMPDIFSTTYLFLREKASIVTIHARVKNIREVDLNSREFIATITEFFPLSIIADNPKIIARILGT